MRYHGHSDRTTSLGTRPVAVAVGPVAGSRTRNRFRRRQGHSTGWEMRRVSPCWMSGDLDVDNTLDGNRSTGWRTGTCAQHRVGKEEKKTAEK